MQAPGAQPPRLHLVSKCLHAPRVAVGVRQQLTAAQGAWAWVQVVEAKAWVQSEALVLSLVLAAAHAGRRQAAPRGQAQADVARPAARAAGPAAALASQQRAVTTAVSAAVGGPRPLYRAPFAPFQPLLPATPNPTSEPQLIDSISNQHPPD